MAYLKKSMLKFSPWNRTPQSEPIPGSAQVPNSAGGYAFPVDDWKRLDRFLILGSEGGSYYIKETALTAENASAVIRCINSDGQRVVRRIVEISDSGRAPKNDPAIFALALAISQGDSLTRQVAAEALPKVCRIGTHLFHFAEYVDSLRGWGRGLRRAVAGWYVNQPANGLAYQAIKYQQREGWSHRDLLRLAHPTAPDEAHNILFHWMVKGWPGVGEEPHPIEAVRVVWAMERARTADKAELLKLVRDYRLPREALPTRWLTDPDVWLAMLPHLGLTALLRNLGNLSRVGLLVEGNREVIETVVHSLASTESLRKARVHPIAVLTAMLTYGAEHGARGSGKWTPVQKVIDALDSAFYKSFGNVEPSGKPVVLALDVSGSMGVGMVAGVLGLTPRIAGAAMALITAATEQEYWITGFSHELVPIAISPRQRLDDVVKVVEKIPMGGTDCALPMLWARRNRIEAEAFVVYTDSETWFGKIHPVQALHEYRQAMGIAAKLIVVGMVSNGFTIADPDDAGMLDVVGFDSAVPQMLGGFIKDPLQPV